MNKVLIVGRLTRDPSTKVTSSNIKFTRFTVAVNREFGENQTDFIPAIAWRNQAEFVDKYLRKGSLVSIEGRFTTSSYVNNEQKTVYNYEVSVDRIQGLESKNQSNNRSSNSNFDENHSYDVKELQFTGEKKTSAKEEDEMDDVPWDIDI